MMDATLWGFTVKKRTAIRLGDCYEIPLPDGRLAYCRHINRNDKLGFLIEVYDLFRDAPLLDASALRLAKRLFPPVFVGLLATVRSGRWTYIGNVPVDNFQFPLFRSCMGTKPGTYDSWHIWNGSETKKIGKLPEKFRSLELKCVFGDEALEERITTGYWRGNHMF